MGLHHRFTRRVVAICNVIRGAMATAPHRNLNTMKGNTMDLTQWIYIEELNKHLEIRTDDGKHHVCLWSHDDEHDQVGHQITQEYEVTDANL